MAILTKGQAFADSDSVTSTKLNNLVDNAAFVAGASGSTDNTSLEVNGSGKLQVKDLGISSVKIGSNAVTYAKVQPVASMKALGNVTALSGTVSEIPILDEDDMASDSAVALSTQQSIKAYVDLVDLSKLQIYHVRDQKTSGTAGGVSTAATHKVRVLNTEVNAGITGASLASNQVTLPAGTYSVHAISSVYNVARNRANLYNVTDSVITLDGTNCWANADTNGISHVKGVFTIASSKVFSLRHYTQSAGGADALGVAVSNGASEVYADLMFTKIA